MTIKDSKAALSLAGAAGLDALADAKDFPELCHAASSTFSHFRTGERVFRAKMTVLAWFIYTQEAWKGTAGSWSDFLDDNQVPYQTAMWGKRVFETYCIDCGLGYSEYEDLIVNSNPKCLDKARRVVTKENIYEWIDKLKYLKLSDMLDELDKHLGKSEAPDIRVVEEALDALRNLPLATQRSVVDVLGSESTREVLRRIDRMRTPDFLSAMEIVREEGIGR